MTQYAVVRLRTARTKYGNPADRDLVLKQWPPDVGVPLTVPTTLEKAQAALMTFVRGGDVPDELIYQGEAS